MAGADTENGGTCSPGSTARPRERSRAGQGAFHQSTPLTLAETASVFGETIPHFVNSPGYVYAYAYGQLLALSVYERYEQGGPELVPLPGATGCRRLEKP